MSTSAVTKKRPHSRHQTQWASQFAVASELIKRGYEVAFTTGNHPMKDLMVVSPLGMPFTVDVKGVYRPNPFYVKQKKPCQGLYYILTCVPQGKPNDFFILTQDEANTEVKNEFDASKKKKLMVGKTIDPAKHHYGIRWKDATTYKEKWSTLPK